MLASPLHGLFCSLCLPSPPPTGFPGLFWGRLGPCPFSLPLGVLSSVHSADLAEACSGQPGQSAPPQPPKLPVHQGASPQQAVPCRGRRVARGSGHPAALWSIGFRDLEDSEDSGRGPWETKVVGTTVAWDACKSPRYAESESPAGGSSTQASLGSAALPCSSGLQAGPSACRCPTRTSRSSPGL